MAAKKGKSQRKTSARASASARATSASTRALLIVDNRPLRQRHFAEAQKVIQKIERLEDRIRTFHSSDQTLFNQWFDLTFRGHKLQQEEARTKYPDLARFHNWIVATAHKLDLEMPQAYMLMRNEQRRWNDGTEEERKAIELERSRRDDYIRHEFRARYNEDVSFMDDDEDDSVSGGIDGLQQVLDRLEDMVFEADRCSDQPAESRIDRIMAMSDGDLIKAMDDQEVAFMMFDVSLNWGQTHRDYAFFKRLWTLMTGAQKTFFSYVYSSVTDEPIEDLLQRLGLGFADENAADENEDEPVLNDEQNEYDEYVDPRPGQRGEPTIANRRPGLEDDTKLKQTFRKLMRKLHPDVHAADSKTGHTPSWVQRIWGMVQSAYTAKNIPILERLLKLTLIRMKVLDELTVGEIVEARHWLKKDLENLEEESSELKYSLAWGFSQKKTYASLQQKIAKQFISELREIKEQVTELEDQHQLLEMLAQRSPRNRPQRKNRSAQRRRGISGRGRRSSSRQQEFSFED